MLQWKGGKMEQRKREIAFSLRLSACPKMLPIPSHPLSYGHLYERLTPGSPSPSYSRHSFKDIKKLLALWWPWCCAQQIWTNKGPAVSPYVQRRKKGQHLHSRCFFLGAITSWVVALQTARAISDPVSWYCAAAMRSVSVCPDIFSPLSRPAQECISPGDERIIYKCICT